MKSVLCVLFGAIVIFGLSCLPNPVLAQNEPPAKSPAKPEIVVPEEEAEPLPDSMPLEDDEVAPPDESEIDPLDSEPLGSVPLGAGSPPKTHPEAE